MKKIAKQIGKPLLFTVLFILVIAGCKKNKTEESETPSLIGMWSHLRTTGTSRHTVTQLHFNEDNSGREIIISIVGSQNSVVSNERFQWSTQNNNLLKLQINGETETYSYVINKAEGLLRLTNANGDAKDYYKDE